MNLLSKIEPIHAEQIFFNNKKINLIDYTAKLNSIYKELIFQLEELVKFLSGESSRANLYNNIVLKEQEDLFLFYNVRNINITHISDVDKLISKSIRIGKFGIFKLVSDATFDDIVPFSFLQYSVEDQDKNDITCTSLFLEDKPFDNKIIFIILLRYIEMVIDNAFSKLGLNMNILYYDGEISNVNQSLFIVRYYKTLLTPLVKLFRITEEDKEIIYKWVRIHSNELIDKNFVSKIFDYIYTFDTNFDLEYDCELIYILNVLNI